MKKKGTQRRFRQIRLTHRGDRGSFGSQVKPIVMSTDALPSLSQVSAVPNLLALTAYDEAL